MDVSLFGSVVGINTRPVPLHWVGVTNVEKGHINLLPNDIDLKRYVESTSTKKVTKTKNRASSSDALPIREENEYSSPIVDKPFLGPLTDHRTNKVPNDKESTASRRFRSPVRSVLVCGTYLDL